MFPADVSTKNLKKLMYYLTSDNLFVGSAVTAPYKEKVLKYINYISPEAKVIGSINTIKKIDNQLVGHNTDYHGAIKNINKTEKPRTKGNSIK